ncbi:MAG: hypothetical protein NW237_09325 [Cyanobacteriota bacterium]|nr:hypothetical protein [Cyanobacteriota bacterium]
MPSIPLPPMLTRQDKPTMHSLSRDAEKLLAFYQKLSLWSLGVVWLGIGIPSLWGLRVEIGRLWEYFTWAGLRYSLFYEPRLPNVGLLFCLAYSLTVMISESRYQLIGLLKSERDLLEMQTRWLLQLPHQHPLRRCLLADQPPRANQS